MQVDGVKSRDLKPHISDGLLGFLLSVPRRLNAVVHLPLNVREIGLQLLSAVQQGGVLEEMLINSRICR